MRALTREWLAVLDLIPQLPQPTIKDGKDVVINLLKL
jgi:hypothetical protein